MRSALRTCVLALAAGAVSLPACGGGRSEPEVAARVVGAEIDASETQALAATLQQTESQNRPEDQDALDEREIERVVLAHQIRLVYLKQVAADYDVELKPDPRAEALVGAVSEQSYKAAGWRSAKDYARSIEASRLSKAIAEKLFPKVPIQEDELKRAYDQEAKRLSAPSWRAFAEVAYFQDEALANQLRLRVEQSGEPFLAAASSLGAAESGPIEATSFSLLPPAILDALGEVPAPSIGPPILFAKKWYAVLNVKSREDLPGLQFADVRDDLARLLEDQKRQAMFDEWFGKRLSKAQVEVDRYYGKWEPSSQTVGDA